MTPEQKTTIGEEVVLWTGEVWDQEQFPCRPLRPELAQGISWELEWITKPGKHVMAVERLPDEDDEPGDSPDIYIIHNLIRNEVRTDKLMLSPEDKTFYFDVFYTELAPMVFMDHGPMYVPVAVGRLTEGASWRPYRVPTYKETMVDNYASVVGKIENILDTQPDMVVLDRLIYAALKHVGPGRFNDELPGKMAETISSQGENASDEVRMRLSQQLLLLARQCSGLKYGYHLRGLVDAINNDPRLLKLLNLTSDIMEIRAISWMKGF